MVQPSPLDHCSGMWGSKESLDAPKPNSRASALTWPPHDHVKPLPAKGCGLPSLACPSPQQNVLNICGRGNWILGLSEFKCALWLEGCVGFLCSQDCAVEATSSRPTLWSGSRYVPLAPLASFTCTTNRFLPLAPVAPLAPCLTYPADPLSAKWSAPKNVCGWRGRSQATSVPWVLVRSCLQQQLRSCHEAFNGGLLKSSAPGTCRFLLESPLHFSKIIYRVLQSVHTTTLLCQAKLF